MSSFLGKKRASPSNDPVPNNWDAGDNKKKEEPNQWDTTGDQWGADGNKNEVENLKKNLKDTWNDKKDFTNETSSNSEADKKELFVRNISFDSTENDLREFFSKFGEVTRVKIVSKDGKPKGFGFVEFTTHESAQKAIDQQDTLNFQGRQLAVKFSEGGNGRKGGNDRPLRDSGSDRRPLRDSGSDRRRDSNFEKPRGRGRGDRGRGDFRGRGRGRGGNDRNERGGFNRRESSEDNSRTDFFGQSSSDRPRRDGGCSSLFAKNLPFNVSEDDLRGYFSKFGEIKAIRLGKGFCHIDFFNESDLEKALSQNGEEFMGRKLFLDKAQPRGNNSNGDSRGGFRGGRGGRGRDH